MGKGNNFHVTFMHLYVNIFIILVLIFYEVSVLFIVKIVYFNYLCFQKNENEKKENMSIHIQREILL